MRDVFDSGPKAARAIGLMASIRYQVFAPGGAAQGPCPGCGELSRGGARCADCADRDLAGVLGVNAPTDYLRACRVQRAAEHYVIATADTLDAQEHALKRQPECRVEPEA